jgi:hypothetical protein
VASITRWRVELAGRLRDLSKIPLPGTVPQPHGFGQPWRHLRHHYEKGLSARRGIVEEIFDPHPPDT